MHSILLWLAGRISSKVLWWCLICPCVPNSGYCVFISWSCCCLMQTSLHDGCCLLDDRCSDAFENNDLPWLYSYFVALSLQWLQRCKITPGPGNHSLPDICKYQLQRQKQCLGKWLHDGGLSLKMGNLPGQVCLLYKKELFCCFCAPSPMNDACAWKTTLRIEYWHVNWHIMSTFKRYT